VVATLGHSVPRVVASSGSSQRLKLAKVTKNEQTSSEDKCFVTSGATPSTSTQYFWLLDTGFKQLRWNMAKFSSIFPVHENLAIS
jgi:hypothetical protein